MGQAAGQHLAPSPQGTGAMCLLSTLQSTNHAPLTPATSVDSLCSDNGWGVSIAVISHRQFSHHRKIMGKTTDKLQRPFSPPPPQGERCQQEDNERMSGMAGGRSDQAFPAPDLQEASMPSRAIQAHSPPPDTCARPMAHTGHTPDSQCWGRRAGRRSAPACP